MLDESTRPVQAFFNAYRTAFEGFDPAAIARFFAYPSHITSDANKVVTTVIATEEEWTRQIERLLGTYRRIGVSSARVLDLTEIELSPRLHQAVLHWALHDAAGGLLYRFQATYTLAEIDGALRITALAHNELPQLQERLALQGSHG